ncbi:peptide chain release factor N(5)-glutamine methyltransferase [Spongiivirga sp. MCCC 1A20706]|uniref:peptide chain release factor N(5)-glutamine methyltransferase n=1 Tax=Spongiivirga sp. MCCC 1A20706 TaxID=3160963 RepID=UPI0039776C34
MELKEIQGIFHKELDNQFGKEEVSSFFFMLTEHFFGVSRLTLALKTSIQLTKSEQSIIYDALSRLKANKPIQYIIGKTHFYGLDFKVNEHTLIPRPETEELVQWILDDYSKVDDKLSVLDIGTGTGCIAISLAKNLASAMVDAIDVDENTLKVAHQNAISNEVKVNFILQDILAVTDLKNYNIIVSNPPYVRDLEKEQMQQNVLDHEPEKALFVSDDNPLIFYEKIAKLAFTCLSDNSALYFEINEYLSDETKELCEACGFKKVTVKNDIFGKPRMIKAKM